MIVSFAEARSLVLLALLDRLQNEDVQHWFTAQEIKQSCPNLSGTLASRAAADLVEDGLVQRSYSSLDDDGTEQFNLSVQGIAAAELVVAGSEINPELLLSGPIADRAIEISEKTDVDPVIAAIADADETVRGANSIDASVRDWIRENLNAGKILIATRRITTNAVKSLLLAPLQAAWKAVAEEKGKALILLAIRAVKSLVGWN